VRPSGTKLWLYRYRLPASAKTCRFGTFRVGLRAAVKSAITRKSCSIGAKIISARGQATGRRKAKAHLPGVGKKGDDEAREREQGQVDDQAGTLKSRSAQSRDRRPTALRDRSAELLTAFGVWRPVVRYSHRRTPTLDRFAGLPIWRRASYCSSDPTRDLKHALTKAPKAIASALTDPDDVGDLMRRIEVYDAKNGGRCATRSS